MHELFDLIRMTALQACDSTQPCDVVCGRVESVDPLTVTWGGVQVHLIRRANEPSLAENDAVLLLRQYGGQAFVILDKAVKE